MAGLDGYVGAGADGDAELNELLHGQMHTCP
jgi:hypothetical protein